VASIVTIASVPSDDFCADDDGDDGNCPQSIDESALAYFVIATLVLLSCVFSFLSLDAVPFVRCVTRGTYILVEISKLNIRE
jgi:hypothetical protein